ncbi:MAG: MopE-related protein, partial [Flavobacteriales bacterium]
MSRPFSLNALFKRVSIILYLFFGLFYFSSGQEPDFSKLMQDPNANFFEVQSQFKNYWNNRPYERGKGYKQFKRWENFMQPRVAPDGTRFAPDAIYRAMQNQPEMFGLNNSQPGNWSYIGNTSVPTGGGGAGRVNAVVNEPGSTTTYYACAPGGGLWKTTNSGVSWTVMNTDFLASIGISDVVIDPNNVNTLYIATGDGDAGDTYSIGVWKSTDGGNTWAATGLNWAVTQTFTISRLLMDPTNSNTLIAATNGGIYRSTNAGVSWTNVQGGSFKDLKFKPGDPNTVYACSNALFKSTNNGATWTNITTSAGSGLPATANISRLAIAVSAANPAYVYVLAGGSAAANGYGFSGVFRSTDSGTTFTTRSTTPNLLGWSQTGNDTGGQAWYDLRIECDPSNAEIVFTGGVNIWKSVNGGTTWTNSSMWYTGTGSPYVHADIHALYWIPGTTTLLIGCDGGVFRTTNSGTAYSDLSSNLQIAQMYCLGTAATNANRVITGWQDNGTNLKDGTAHSRPLGGDGMECIIDPTNANVMYGEIYYGQIYKSTNGGVSFSTIVNSGGTAGTVNEDGAWVTPYVLGSNAQHLYVGKTRVYKSTNGGTSFTALGAVGTTTSVINQLCVAPSDNNVIYCSKGATLYKSTDGNLFTALTGLPGQSISYICVDPTNASRVWVTLSGFSAGNKVFYSANGGTSWTNVSLNLPNIPATCIIYQAGTADGLYVGTDAGVYYKDSSLSTWQPYMNNLPNVVIGELEIHYNSGTIVAATYGRGLWSAPLYVTAANDASLSAVNAPTAGNVCSAAVSPEVMVTNVGTTDLTSFTIQYGVATQAIFTYNWTGTLTTGQSVTIPLNAYNYGTGSFTFNASLISINGAASDENSTNNAQTVTYSVITAPVNDVCAGATTIVVNAAAISADNSATCTDAANPTCGGTSQIKDLWYKFVYTSGIINIQTTLGSLTDTRLALYNACGGTQLACNDDAAGLGYASKITMACGTLTAGQTYYIQVGGYDSAVGSFSLIVTSAVPIVNDACSAATPITTFGTAVACNNTATCVDGPALTCGSASVIKDLWYSFTYTGGTVSIATSGGTLTDTQLAVYAACGGAAVACDDDDNTGNYSLINFGCTPGTGVAGAAEAYLLIPGTTYYIQAGGYGTTSGTFNLTVTVTNVNGCTDPSACNYNPCANVNTGCVFPVTYYQDADGDGFGNAAVSQSACSLPVGYVSNSTDCNDGNNAVRPTATEVCNTIDDDCDALIDEGVQTTFYRDQDGDGFGNLAVTTQACSAPVGYVSNSTDCNDNNNAVRPTATEVCNTIDDDCDALIDEGVQSTFYRDQDGDGFGNLAITTQACSAPVGYVSNSTDCNDNNNAVRPNATEVCNSIDDDCDTQIDEGVQTTFYRDQDGDGFGNLAITTQACSAPVGYVSNSTDCNDNNNAIRPNATEVCNSIDDDCDTQIDEGLLVTYYQDNDGDGFGNSAITTSACSIPGGYSATGGDCNDNSNTIYPSAGEQCNSIDDDCDTLIDEGVVSQNWYPDTDGDGYGAGTAIVSCSQPVGYVLTNTDCAPTNAAIHPGATEVCNSLDDDCDTQIDEGVQTTFYRDADGDGFGTSATTTLACSAPAGYVSNNTDCDDSNSAVRPNATETCNGIDDDCDALTDEGVQSTFYRDQDGDGFGNLSITTQACSAPVGYVSNSTDCNDNNNAIRPNATEVCNGYDDDCDGLTDEGATTTYYIDADGDGFGNLAVTTQACSVPLGYVSNSNDCNDSNSAINPNATEACNGVNDDCDFLTDEGCSVGTIPNDEMATAINVPYNPMGSCSWTAGTLLGATPSNNVQTSCITCNDAWYRFIPTQGGARIQCNTSANNLIVALCDQTGNMIDAENIQSSVGNEILNFGQLTEGSPYFIRVINYNSAQGEGAFNLCVSALADSRCNYGPGPYGLCSTFKA